MSNAIRLDARRRILVFSMHDVMPETLSKCRQLFDLLDAASLGPVTLLVVPGRGWSNADIDELRELCRRGAVLAGHGWQHRADNIRGLRHRLHSALFSRDVAEHLALDEGGIIELINRCHAWFGDHDLDVSDLYVPPAWALGDVRPRALAEHTPFRLFETLTGTIDAASGRFRRSPMVGFEADTRFRAIACSAWNQLNLFAAGSSHPVRVAIHPDDLSLKLANALLRLVERGGHSVSYDIFSSTA